MATRIIEFRTGAINGDSKNFAFVYGASSKDAFHFETLVRVHHQCEDAASDASKEVTR